MLMLFMLLIWLTQEGHNLLQLLSQGQAVLLLHLLIHELCESRFDRVLIPALEKDDVFRLVALDLPHSVIHAVFPADTFKLLDAVILLHFKAAHALILLGQLLHGHFPMRHHVSLGLLLRLMLTVFFFSVAHVRTNGTFQHPAGKLCAVDNQRNASVFNIFLQVIPPFGQRNSAISF